MFKSGFEKVAVTAGKYLSAVNSTIKTKGAEHVMERLEKGRDSSWGNWKNSALKNPGYDHMNSQRLARVWIGDRKRKAALGTIYKNLKA